MIRYRNEHTGLEDWRVPVSGTEKPSGGSGGWRIVLLLVVAALITVGVLYFHR